MKENVAWVYLEGGRILVTRNIGRDVFYLPGGIREAGESDADTLVRELDEELTVRIDPGSMRHVGTYLGRRDQGRTRSG